MIPIVPDEKKILQNIVGLLDVLTTEKNANQCSTIIPKLKNVVCNIDDGRDGDYDANVCNGFFSRNYAALAKVTKFYAKILFLMVMKRLDDTSNMIIVWKKLGVVSVHHMHLLLLMKLSTNVQTLIVQIVCLFLFKEGQLSLISLNTDLDHPHLRLFTLELKDNSYHSLIKSYPALGQILEAVEANRLKD
ncbi:uncharacterized protein OCT59_027674 [Rhizophagus irregularis]|uniref:uncharacterized protein n=1 Tax=Rhizophagus irregularis TaxID=588596 RepID=UPI00332324EA|nr:hypothetical protein OCT59_027674 [Rhizophagus irregularis]